MGCFVAELLPYPTLFPRYCARVYVPLFRLINEYPQGRVFFFNCLVENRNSRMYKSFKIYRVSKKGSHVLIAGSIDQNKKKMSN